MLIDMEYTDDETGKYYSGLVVACDACHRKNMASFTPDKLRDHEKIFKVAENHNFKRAEIGGFVLHFCLDCLDDKCMEHPEKFLRG